MNRKLMAAAIAIAMFSGPILAETDPVAEIDKDWAAQAESRQKMHAHMARMQATMEKIHAEEDASVRKELMHEHMQEMRTMMDMMGGMQGMDMMGGKPGMGMMGRHGDKGHAQGMPQDGAMPMCKDDTAQCQQMNAMAKRQAHMTQKMGMMQEMMQQMMEREAVHEGKGIHEHE
jgi:hypothetical protein